MVLNFQLSLSQALSEIGPFQYQEWTVHEPQQKRTGENHSQLIERYGQSKWAVVDVLNERYSRILKDKFDLYHWLDYNEKDEVAYFLNEAGSNCLNYAEHKVPFKFRLWTGKKGFIIGIEQLGAGFNAVKIDQQRLKENEGAAFEFFRNCKSQIFFDNSENTKMVFMKYLMSKTAEDHQPMG